MKMAKGVDEWSFTETTKEGSRPARRYPGDGNEVEPETCFLERTIYAYRMRIPLNVVLICYIGERL